MAQEQITWRFEVANEELSQVEVQVFPGATFQKAGISFDDRNSSTLTLISGLEGRSSFTGGHIHTKTLLRNRPQTLQGRLFGSFGVGQKSTTSTLKSDVTSLMRLAGLDLLISLTPRRVVSMYVDELEELHKHGDVIRKAEISLPNPDRFEGAVLFADVSGFAKMAQLYKTQFVSNRLASDALASTINEVFKDIVQKICEHGGDIIKFAGDGVLAVFSTSDFDDDMEAAVRACAFVASRIVNTEHSDKNGAKVHMHCGIGSGLIYSYHLGGEGHHVEYFLSSEIIMQISETEPQAAASQVVASMQASQYLKDYLDTESKTKLKFNCQLLRSDPSLFTGFQKRNKQKELYERVHQLSPTVQNLLEQFLDFYVSRPVSFMRQTGNSQWSSEVRICSTMFIRLDGIRHDNTSSILAAIHRVIVVTQTSVSTFGGALLRFTVDEKGANMLIAFGLAPRGASTDGVRTIKCALDIQQKIRDVSYIQADKIRHLRCSIGISTGKVFCGTIGGNIRREYTVHGTSVNFANNLMVEAHDKILVDTDTYQDAKSVVLFAPKALKVRNKATPKAPADAYEAIGLRDEVDIARFVRDDYWIQIGRDSEENSFQIQIDNLMKNRKRASSLLVMEGDNGMGKTQFCKYAARRAKRSNIATIILRGEEPARHIPLYLWHKLCIQILDRSGKRDFSKSLKGGLYKTLLKIIQSKYRKQTKHKFNSERAEGMLKFLSGYAKGYSNHNDSMEDVKVMIREVIEVFVEDTPLCIIIDDLHLADEASQMELSSFARFKRVNLVVTFQQLKSEDVEIKDQLIDLWSDEGCDTCFLPLKALSYESIKQLLHLWLDVGEIPDIAVDYIFQISKGVPIYAKALAKQHCIFDHRGQITAEAVCFMESGDFNFDLMKESFTADFAQRIAFGIITKIDRLSETQRLILKTASVIGAPFNYMILKQLFISFDVLSDVALETNVPLVNAAAGSDEILDSLILKNLVVFEEENLLIQIKPDVYMFPNEFIRNVAYSLIVKEIKIKMHACIVSQINDKKIKFEGIDDESLTFLVADHMYKAENYAECLQKVFPLLENCTLVNRKLLFIWYPRIIELREYLVSSGEISKQVAVSWYLKLGELYLESGHTAYAAEIFNEYTNMLATIIPENEDERTLIVTEIEKIRQRILEIREMSS